MAGSYIYKKRLGQGKAADRLLEKRVGIVLKVYYGVNKTKTSKSRVIKTFANVDLYGSD